MDIFKVWFVLTPSNCRKIITLVKIRAQRTRLWFNPWKGALFDRAAFNLQLERWSVGVLENRTHDKHLPGIKPEIDGILFLWRPRALDHYSITPILHHSLDFSRQSRLSVT